MAGSPHELVFDRVEIAAPAGTADALLVRPADERRHPAVVVYTDAYGIRPAVEEHAARLARHGYAVLVPNVFYRHGPPPVLEDLEARMGAADRAPLFEALRPKMAALTPEAANADARAWLTYVSG